LEKGPRVRDAHVIDLEHVDSKHLNCLSVIHKEVWFGIED